MAMLRGLESRNEQDPQKLLRDVRTLGQRIADFFKNPVSVAIVLCSMGIAGFFLPGLIDVIVLVGIGIFLYAFTRKITLPFRMPLRAHVPDYNDLKPSSNKPFQSRGIAYFGNDLRTNEELWFNNDDLRTHVLIFGSTGSGKTESLVSFGYNALLHGSGFIYVDGKGDNSLFAKIFAMARRMGREDDVLLVNFMTGARDIVGPQEKRLSNTMNPFSNGSSSMLSQLIVSLMDSSSNTPDGDMWKGRAISFVEALMKILVYMRDQGHILLDANTIRNYFILDRLEAMVVDKLFIRDNQEPVSLEDIPEVILEPIKNYLINLPGYDKSKKGKQVSQVLEQHGFITMQLTRVFTSLADTYGHIIRTNIAEVDFKDVVLNRRILVVLLPALEKSPDELANLGKVIIATLKAMMAAGLGEQVEGSYRELIQRKPTNAPTPFLCILDEYGYYAVQGFAVVPAQARSLGFSTIFAGQDLPAFQKASKEEAASIGANTNIKICMKLEDPVETWEFFSKTAGEAYVTKVDAFQTRADSITNAYLDTRSASSEKRARIDLLDLKEQGLGEAHIFFKSKIVRAKLFYANPPPIKYMRLNQFLKVGLPPSKVLKDLEARLDKFSEAIKAEAYAHLSAEYNEEIELVAENLEQNAYLEPIERSLSALIHVHNKNYGEEIEEEIEETLEKSAHSSTAAVSVEEPKKEIKTEKLKTQEVRMDEEVNVNNQFEVPETELNIFTPLRVNKHLKDLLLETGSNFKAPIVNRTEALAAAQKIERLSGKSEKQAQSAAKELINDMQIATFYPPNVLESITTENVVAAIDELIEKLKAAREDD